MGKKSKKNAARAKASTAAAASAAPAAASTDRPSATGMSGASAGCCFEGKPDGGGIVVAAIGKAAAAAAAKPGKKPKCTNCLALLKDPAKAHRCPGCFGLYCWRCEKKKFRECLNGRHCVDPLRRCFECAGGKTIAKLDLFETLSAEGSIATDPFVDEGALCQIDKANRQIEEYVAKDDQLTEAALPFRYCMSAECRWNKRVIDEQGTQWKLLSECHACASGTDTSRPSHFRKCFRCCLMRCTMCNDENDERVLDGLDRCSTDTTLRLEELRTHCRRTLFTCKDCMRDICVDCNLKSTRGGQFRIHSSGLHTLCPPCTEKKYWSTKPCTNPSCPNEAGVPTKRCGDCHIARYCSVECQGMAYPAHGAKCRAISAKRVAAGK